MLTDLIVPPFLDTSSADLIEDFFVPALANACRYDRAVGYFSSGWLRIAAIGMGVFASNGGTARWVTSPILDPSDWEALEVGDAARTDPILHSALERNVSNLIDSLQRDTLSALAWMVADEIIEFRLALPKNKLERGDFHDKFGIFYDGAGNSISFNGSYNDSIQGTRNYESIKVFRSWQSGFESLANADVARFERLWSNEDPNVRIFKLPDAARERILQLRTGDRPYIPNKQRALSLGTSSTIEAIQPRIPNRISLYDYQKDAISGWFANDCKGLLEMATGTGKTITALAATTRLFDQCNSLFLVITVPYQHLVDQWNAEAQPFGFRPILAYESQARWRNALDTCVIEFNGGYRKLVTVITTHKTFGTQPFQACIQKVKPPALLIADEAHHLGAEQSRQAYPQNIGNRLALSATPDRWFDDIGTAALRRYFGQTVFTFSLAEAIGFSLTPYYYYPHLVPLTDDEIDEYESLSRKIGQLVGRDDDEQSAALKMLLIRRAELLNKAANKIPALSQLIDEQESVEHALFYCAPGQIDDVMSLVGWEKGLLVHRFTAEESADERRQILADFASGDLQALAAMKCLDEGVDVPSTKTAFFLASSSNPREFVQRRGRILRRAPGKEFSVIHDLIAVPPDAWSGVTSTALFAAERSVLRRELERFREFANPAINKHQAIDVIWDIARRYGLMDF